ncbi:MAG: gamma carbonic anhydrase family protein [Proteobacteria bacterium]|nr:gamma carbonic anhydrase family protein [Pseudomonadota bacterium]
MKSVNNENARLGMDVRFGQNVVKTGTVTIGDHTSIWHNVVLRGDVQPIIIGERCNIQDNTVIHGQLNKWAATIGNNVSVGHSCILHGCELADESFVGMGSIIMNGCYIGSRVLVAAGSLITEGSRFEDPNSLVMGRPGKVVRELKESEIEMIENTPARYIEYARKWLIGSCEKS